LRQEWKKESAKTFVFEESDTCPTCGQTLPAEQVQETRDKALADFNAHKAQRLEDVSNQGKIAKATNDKLSEQIATTEEQIAEAESKLAELNSRIIQAQSIVESLEKQEYAYLTAPAYIALTEKQTGIEHELEKLKKSNYAVLSSQKNELTNIDKHIEECEKTIAQINQREKGLKRIEELKGEERELAKEFEHLESDLFLIETFIRTKVTILEGKINSRFALARFKLFNQLVNGGIEECCETTYQGIPYSSALNNSARINIGLDTINTLSEYFGFVAPIWMDNAEAVTKMLPTKGQQIKLYVSQADKVLRIENKKEV